MAESQLRSNSLRLRFERGNPEPSDMEVFKFMKTKMLLKCESLLSMYKEKQDLSVIIKFKTEEELKSSLRKLPGTMEFTYDKYRSTVVQLSAANAIVRYVRIFNLPPEVEDREIWNAITKYGKVQRMVRERYPESTGFPIWSTVRGAYIELKEGAEIPATLQIRGIRARVYYEGLINKCFQCGATEHLKAECPSRKSVNDRMTMGQASYSGAVTGGESWSKQNANSSSSGDHGRQTMTNLNALFGKNGASKPHGIEKEPRAATGGENEMEQQKQPDKDLEKKQLPQGNEADDTNDAATGGATSGVTDGVTGGVTGGVNSGETGGVTGGAIDAKNDATTDAMDDDDESEFELVQYRGGKGGVKRTHTKGKGGDSGESSDASTGGADAGDRGVTAPQAQKSISEQQGIKTRGRSKQVKLTQEKKERSRSNRIRNRRNSETDVTKYGAKKTGKLNSSQPVK